MIYSCELINLIDFDNEKELTEILLRDKHTRIEGLCAEEFFKEELLVNNFDTYSTSWWFVKKTYGYSISKFTQSINDLSSMDVELLKHFSIVNNHVFIIEFCKEQNTVFYSRIENGAVGRTIRNWDVIKKKLPRNDNKSVIPLEKERNLPRLKQAIAYLIKRNCLEETVIERIFANCWLGNASCWDIDFLVRYKDKFIVFEVKQKFKTAKGTWGLNVGLANLFKYLNLIDIDVIHVILTKPVRDANLHAIDFYTKEEYRKNSNWIATKFSETSLSEFSEQAPAKTSIHGSSEISYYNLSNDVFSLIKKVSSKTDTIMKYLYDHL